MPYPNPVTFDVAEAWKGVPENSVVVYGEGSEASCGIDFDEGETCLVFAYHSGDTEESPLQTDFCGATEQVDLETARQILGPPADLPDTGGIASEVGRIHAGVAYGAAAVAVSLAFLGGFWSRRMRGRSKRGPS